MTLKELRKEVAYLEALGVEVAAHVQGFLRATVAIEDCPVRVGHGWIALDPAFARVPEEL